MLHSFRQLLVGGCLLSAAISPGCKTAQQREALVAAPEASSVVTRESVEIVATSHDEQVDPPQQPAELLPAVKQRNEIDAAGGVYPIDFATALATTAGQNPQVAQARQRIAEAYAQAEAADVLWVPSLRAGMNYNKHEGTIQDVAGNMIETSRGSV